MNSHELKSKFDSVYRKFFCENSIVISMPFVMTWCGDYSESFNGINIKQKIPLRIYVGINQTKNEGISINRIKYFDSIENEFLEEVLKIHSNSFGGIEEILKSRFQGKDGGLQLSILSELSGSVGLGFDAILGTLMICAIERVRGNINDTVIKDIHSKDLKEVWKIYKNILDPIFNTAYQCLIGSYKSFPITGDISTSFYNGTCPFVTIGVSQSFGQEYEKIIFKGESARLSRFSEFIKNVKGHLYLPIDYGIIYSGQPVSIGQVLNSSIHAFDWIPETKEQLGGFFKSVLGKGGSELTEFYENFLDQNNQAFKNIFPNLIMAVSLQIFNLMALLYRKGFSEENVNALIFSLNKFRYSNYIRRISHGFLEFISEIEKNINLPNHLAIFPNTTTIMGGSVNFVLPLERYRSNLRQGVEQSKKTHKGSKILYESWVDGVEQNGLAFEQDISCGIFSQYSQEKSFIFKHSGGEISVIDGSEFNLIKNNEEIIIDKIRNKILINGEYLNSKELISQSATIEILCHLLEGKGKEIYCKDLVISSYSKNKNEMFSKIINPLVKLISEKIGKSICILCTGATEEFYLKIDLGDVKISTLEKMV